MVQRNIGANLKYQRIRMVQVRSSDYVLNNDYQHFLYDKQKCTAIPHVKR